jgi:hypothetical protein
VTQPMSPIRYEAIPAVAAPMLQRARSLAARNARSADEVELFLSMLTPAEARCASCDRHYDDPSLARACEATHEGDKMTTERVLGPGAKDDAPEPKADPRAKADPKATGDAAAGE